MLLISQIRPFCMNNAPKYYRTKPGSIQQHKSGVKKTNLDTLFVYIYMLPSTGYWHKKFAECDPDVKFPLWI